MSEKPLQGGMSNEQLANAWQGKLPGVIPTERDLTAFALGVEVGAERARGNAEPLTDEQIEREARVDVPGEDAESDWSPLSLGVNTVRRAFYRLGWRAAERAHGIKEKP